ARCRGQLDNARAVIDDKADMPALDARLPVIGHPRQVDELVAHIDERVTLPLAAQREIEDLPIPGERLVDIADLDRDMIDADQLRLPAVTHGSLRLMLGPFDPDPEGARKRAIKEKVYRRGRGGCAENAK